MKFLASGNPTPKRKKWIILGVLVLLVYLMMNNATSSADLETYVEKKLRDEVVRFAVYEPGTYSKLVIVRNNQDERTALAFVKFPLLDRWTLTQVESVSGKSTKPIEIEVNNGFNVLKVAVSFQQAQVNGVIGWSGTYARVISVMMFILVAIGIAWWLDRNKRNKVV